MNISLKTLNEFLNDSSEDEGTLEIRRKCNAEGHKPYINGGQGGDGMIHGCYCGWIKIESMAIPTPKLWNDLY